MFSKSCATSSDKVGSRGLAPAEGKSAVWPHGGRPFASAILTLRDKADQAHRARSVALTPPPTSCRPASVLRGPQRGHFQLLSRIARLPHIRQPMCAGQLRWGLPKVDQLALRVELPWLRCGATHPDTSPATTPDCSGPKRILGKFPRLFRNAR